MTIFAGKKAEIRKKVAAVLYIANDERTLQQLCNNF